MPYMKVDTNVEIPAEKAEELLAALSGTLARVTGKPEAVVQISLEGGRMMYMSGSSEPTAHVEVKSIGFQVDSAAPLSDAICRVLTERLGIKGARVFIAFNDFKGAMWGKDGKTLG